MSSHWRKSPNQNKHNNPFLSSRAQESSEKTLEEISRVNPAFTQKHRSNGRGGGSDQNNPYLDDSLQSAQNDYGPDANSQYMAEHGVRRSSPSKTKHVQMVGNQNGFHPQSGSNGADAKSHGKGDDDWNGTVTVRDDNPYHPRNFYTEQKDHDTANALIQRDRKFPKTSAPRKRENDANHKADGDYHEVLDEMDAFFDAVEDRSDSDGDAENDGDGDSAVEEISEHFRQFRADPGSDGDDGHGDRYDDDDDDEDRHSRCIEGCEAITPSNFHTMRPGDVVSILMDGLWTYYKVTAIERNGDDFVAEFESGFGSEEESVFIKHGAISKFVTVWGEQTESAMAICREIEDRRERRDVAVVENGWIKMEDDAKVHLVVAYEESTGMALLKAVGAEEERTVNLNDAAFKVL